MHDFENAVDEYLRREYPLAERFSETGVDAAEGWNVAIGLALAVLDDGLGRKCRKLATMALFRLADWEELAKEGSIDSNRLQQLYILRYGILDWLEMLESDEFKDRFARTVMIWIFSKAEGDEVCDISFSKTQTEQFNEKWEIRHVIHSIEQRIIPATTALRLTLTLHKAYALMDDETLTLEEAISTIEERYR